ncbi:hypothetical protein TKK_0000281 [Trichogramma kaykai]
MDEVFVVLLDKIDHAINFNPQVPKKGKLLVESGHVKNVKEYRLGGTSYKIEARVIRQTSTGKVPYKVELQIVELSKKTILQSKSQLWHESRQPRISASTRVYMIKSKRKSKTDEDLVDSINNTVELRVISNYYTQCQVQMDTLGSILIDVHRDDKFSKYVIPKCEHFYKTLFLEGLVNNADKIVI